MHSNSIAAWRNLDTATRSRMVLDAFAKHGGMTDRQCMEALGFGDMNAVRPRITELVQVGLLTESCNVFDSVTRRNVRCCVPVDEQLELAI